MIKKINNKTILVWHWRDAPKEYKSLLKNVSDDANWIVFVPKGFDGEYIHWLDFTDYAHMPHKYSVEEGTVYIGNHD